MRTAVRRAAALVHRCSKTLPRGRGLVKILAASLGWALVAVLPYQAPSVLASAVPASPPPLPLPPPPSHSPACVLDEPPLRQPQHGPHRLHSRPPRLIH